MQIVVMVATDGYHVYITAIYGDLTTNLAITCVTEIHFLKQTLCGSSPIVMLSLLAVTSVEHLEMLTPCYKMVTVTDLLQVVPKD